MRMPIALFLVAMGVILIGAGGPLLGVPLVIAGWWVHERLLRGHDDSAFTTFMIAAGTAGALLEVARALFVR